MSWIKLPRTVLKSPVFKEPRLLKVWLWCRLKAAYTPTVLNMVVNGQSVAVPLGMGEFIFARQKAANELGISVTTFGREVKRLEQMGHVTVAATNHYSVMKLNMQLLQPKTIPKATKGNISASTEMLSPEEVALSLDAMRGKELKQLMSELSVYSHPQVLLVSYRAYLAKKPTDFYSQADILQHLRQYLLQEWV